MPYHWFSLNCISSGVYCLTFTSRPYLWGEKAIEFQTLHPNDKVTLRSMKMGKMLRLVDVQLMKGTILNFPLKRHLLVCFMCHLPRWYVICVTFLHRATKGITSLFFVTLIDLWFICWWHVFLQTVWGFETGHPRFDPRHDAMVMVECPLERHIS